MQGLKGRGRHVALAGWKLIVSPRRPVLPVTDPDPSVPLHPDGHADVKPFLATVLKGDLTGPVTGDGLRVFLTAFTWSRP